MSHEKHISIIEKHETAHLSSEQLKAQHEEAEKSRHEQAEKAEVHSKDEVLQAHQEAKEAAIASSEIKQPVEERPAVERSHSREDKAHAFGTIMHQVRHNLSVPERTFSKFIHQPAVEKTSEVLGKTVARPSGVIGATTAATLGLLIVYTIARFSGFELSGSEMPLLLGLGFIVGLIAEWSYKAIRVLFSPSKS